MLPLTVGWQFRGWGEGTTEARRERVDHRPPCAALTPIFHLPLLESLWGEDSFMTQKNVLSMSHNIPLL